MTLNCSVHNGDFLRTNYHTETLDQQWGMSTFDIVGYQYPLVLQGCLLCLFNTTSKDIIQDTFEDMFMKNNIHSFNCQKRTAQNFQSPIPDVFNVCSLHQQGELLIHKMIFAGWLLTYLKKKHFLSKMFDRNAEILGRKKTRQN